MISIPATAEESARRTRRAQMLRISAGQPHPPDPGQPNTRTMSHHLRRRASALNAANPDAKIVTAGRLDR